MAFKGPIDAYNEAARTPPDGWTRRALEGATCSIHPGKPHLRLRIRHLTTAHSGTRTQYAVELHGASRRTMWMSPCDWALRAAARNDFSHSTITNTRFWQFGPPPFAGGL